MDTNLFYDLYLKSIPALLRVEKKPVPSSLPQGRALVLSPHYDDEVIGAGGAIALLRGLGEAVKVVYMTDGREGIPELADREVVERTRREESARALEILGGAESFHLRAPETRLSPRRGLLKRLVPIVREFSPEIILLPWFFDNHVDHVETNRILLEISRAISPDATVLGFEVWTPLPVNLYIDITPVAGKKQEALLSFASQISQVDYMRTSMALAKRRALEAGLDGYAEAFLSLPLGEYLGWVRRSGIHSMRFIR
jgi:LmbE family N-acetylglucosaminyl deacetylase